LHIFGKQIVFQEYSSSLLGFRASVSLKNQLYRNETKISAKKQMEHHILYMKELYMTDIAFIYYATSPPTILLKVLTLLPLGGGGGN
jgi:hypothetical protein